MASERTPRHHGGGRRALAALWLCTGCASPPPAPDEAIDEPLRAVAPPLTRPAPAAAQADGPSPHDEATADPVSSPGQLDPEETVITISAVGDCAIGDLQHGAGAPGSFAHQLAQVEDPVAYPFSAVAALLRADDLTIANLEGTLTDHAKFQNEVFSIRGKPAYAKMLVSGGVELVNVENNHSHDYGVVGHTETKASLAAERVAFFGHGTVDKRQVKGVEIVNLGFLGGPEGTLKRATAAVKEHKRPDNVVIVSFHWGIEGSYATHPDQQRLGRGMIDAGADLVLGHHPHVLQGIETYKGRHVVYSLGNFVFGANSKPQDMDSIIYQERFTLRAGVLHEATGRVIPVRISTTTDRNDFRPVLLEGAEAERVEGKVAELSAKLPGRVPNG